MRYKVVPHGGSGVPGWAIWDEKLSPALLEAGVSPWYCSLDGETPLSFTYMSKAYGWLGACEQAGLDLEAEGAQIRIHGTGKTAVSHFLGSGPVIREYPDSLPWQHEG